MEENVEKRLEEIKEKLKSNLFIARVPPNTLKRFKEIANYDDFCEDYGLALKHLVDVYDGLVTTGLEMVEEEMSRLRADMEVLRASVMDKDEQKRTRRMLSGKVLRKSKEE